MNIVASALIWCVISAHELAHVCGGDFLVQAIGQLSVALHFYNPLIHWLSSRLRLEQELRADTVAGAATGGRRTYLTILAEIALQQSNVRVGWPAHAFLPTRGTFLRRIEMLRNKKKLADRSRSVTIATRWATMGVLAIAGLAVAGLRSVAQDVDTSSPVKSSAATDANKPQPAWQFGDVQECIATDEVSAGVEGPFIDFDKGIFLSLPARALWKSDEDVSRWISDSGIDAIANLQADVRGLGGWDMTVIRVGNERWKISPRDLGRALAAGRLGRLVTMRGNGQLPSTYLFKTREGGRGVLQIVGFTKQPSGRNGVKIRYKMLNTASHQARLERKSVATRLLATTGSEGDNALRDAPSQQLEQQKVKLSEADSRPTVEFRLAENEPGEGLTKASLPGQKDVVYLHPDAFLSRQFIASARVTVDDNGSPALNIALTKEGGRIMKQFTSRHLPDRATGKFFRIAILSEAKLLTAPRLPRRSRRSCKSVVVSKWPSWKSSPQCSRASRVIGPQQGTLPSARGSHLPSMR